MTKAKPRKQCAKCPWKKGTNPHDIPDNYCPSKHANLKSTIAKPGLLKQSTALRIMSCHETGMSLPTDLDPETLAQDERQALQALANGDPCVGWMHHQLGKGQNIPLRMAALFGQIDTNIEIVGEQHATFEDTLP